MNRHRWALELLDPAGAAPESIPLGERLDWGPAEECARWSAVRSGDYSPEEAWAAPAAVTPIGSARLGEPYTSGFEVSLGANGKARLSRAFPLTYFRGLAEECALPWVRRGRLSGGDRFRYLIAAFPQDGRSMVAEHNRASIRTLAPALTIEERTTGHTPESLPESARPVDPADPPLLIPRAVLRDATEHALSRPERETGGFLLGRFRRHPDSRDVLTVVTAYLPARAEGTATRLSFTPECWSAARSAIALRRSGEALVGWVHSHIVDALCRGCAEEQRRDCPLASGFFSAHDRTVHRVAFPRAYHTALVVNLSAGRATHSCFGWRDGTIAERGFHIVPTPEAPAWPEHE